MEKKKKKDSAYSITLINTNFKKSFVRPYRAYWIHQFHSPPLPPPLPPPPPPAETEFCPTLLSREQRGYHRERQRGYHRERQIAK